MSTGSLNPSTQSMDSTPLLSDRNRSPGRTSLRGAARFLRRASSRRMMREPSIAVREAAAEQLEERQTDWAYSKPVVFLDLLWNLAFVAVAIGVLAASTEERPVMPLRVWVLGYAAQCVAHMVCVCVEYRKRRGRRSGSGRGTNEITPPRDLEEGSGGYDSEGNQEEERTSIAKHLESANTMFSFIWWIIGFYWVSIGGPSLISDAPQLYWLCIVFLAFDVFFVVFCVALACIIGIAVCCCLPCIIAILYAVADQEGASDEDIHQLPKYKFRRTGDIEKQTDEISRSSGGIMTECGSDPPHEHALSAEDAVCDYCLNANCNTPTRLNDLFFTLLPAQKYSRLQLYPTKPPEFQITSNYIDVFTIHENQIMGTVCAFSVIRLCTDWIRGSRWIPEFPGSWFSSSRSTVVPRNKFRL